jgi:hypothetical protein
VPVSSTCSLILLLFLDFYTRSVLLASLACM